MNRGHEISIVPEAMHVEVKVAGETVAVSDRPVLLHETGLPTRYYLRREDVHPDLLGPTGRRTTCPFKGQASYWSIVVGGECHEDVAWSYQDPIPRAEAIAGLVCFYDDRVDITVGGSATPSADEGPD